jgi:hypothetical protein
LALLSTAALFIAGLIVLLRVDMVRGREAALRADALDIGALESEPALRGAL